MNNKRLKEQVSELEAELKQKQQAAIRLQKEYDKIQAEWKQVRHSRVLSLLNPQTVKQSLRTTAAYILGRRNRKQLYSKTYKQKQASNDLKQYKQALYNEGFTKAALDSLYEAYDTTTNRYKKQAVAWELVLWFANKNDPLSAGEALRYMDDAKAKESDEDSLRRMTIVEAECLHRIGETNKAIALIEARLQAKIHPDLYFSRANLATDEAEKFTWINKVYEMYDLQPIKLDAARKTKYDALITKGEQVFVTGPKISVILPAYNAGEGIKVAIESILAQTWQNLELIIVDDCSPDDTYKIAKSYEKIDNRVKVMQAEKNGGAYIARNLGLQIATGDFVTINDADDWSHTAKLATQANHLLKHSEIIANTSQQARITEDLQFYRRGTPGKYIFSNMSSLMFRRELVMDKIGYWDAVRFAADGEFKRRLTKTFGTKAVIDLQTGPLSLPRQTAGSLTGSSAFGYNGFFMGVRQEYVASFTAYHETAATLYYPPEQPERLFPVPVPMLPTRQTVDRSFDVIIGADFYRLSDEAAARIINQIDIHRNNGLQTGLMQIFTYEPDKKKIFHPQIRQAIDGDSVQMIVYGEKVTSHVCIIQSPKVLQVWQQYIPKVATRSLIVMIDELPRVAYNGNRKINYQFRSCLRQTMTYFDKRGRWYPLNQTIRQQLTKQFAHETRAVTIAQENWFTANELEEGQYIALLENWFVEDR